MTEQHCFILPAELVWLDGRPLLKMVEISATSLDLPFWSQTLAAHIRVVSLLALDEVDHAQDTSMNLSGFIYHFNRCGSTVVAQVLKAGKACLTLSEPFVFQQLLDSEHGTLAQRIVWLRRLMALHLRALAPCADHLVIKWPGLIALYIGDIEAAFPRVPAIFLYRNPIEVLVSARLAPLGNTDIVKEVHLALPLGKRWLEYSGLERTALLMANICRHVMPARDVRLVDYASLPGAIIDDIAPYFGLDLSVEALARMREACRYHAKAPQGEILFHADSSKKCAMANEHERRVAHDLIAPALANMTARLPSLCVPATS